jgi:uncharacterized membrane protein YqaE (UPF0057 family)
MMKTKTKIKDILDAPEHFKNLANKTEDFTNIVKDNISVVREGFYGLGDISKSLSTLVKSIGSMLKIGFWLIKFFLFILGELLNPFNLFNDLFTSFSSLPRVIINVSLRMIIVFTKYIADNILNPIMNKAFGWDLNIKDENGDTIETKSKCYKADENKIPTSVVMSTILLPPLGIFMRFGLQNWIEILICSALSMLYYIPGVAYAFFLLYTK